MKSPLISIIVPLYNYEKYIGDCIQSILNQSYGNFEVIVVDDCSGDRSYKVAKNFESSNVKVLRLENNGGYSRAKNEGIIASQGELIVPLDADDMLTRDSLLLRQREIEKGYDFVHGNAIDVGPHVTLEQAYHINPKAMVRERVRIHAQTVMYSRLVHEVYGLYDENLRSRADKEMWVRLFGTSDQERSSTVSKIKIEEDLAYYRHHRKSMMAYRRHNPLYNKEVTSLLYKAIDTRKKEGILPENTRLLKD